MPAQEIVSMVAIQCKGANPSSELAESIAVTVDLDQSGTRRVGCPYLLKIIAENRLPVNVCQATSNGFKDALITLEEIKRGGWQLEENPTEEVLWDLVMPELVAEFRLCVHKDPA